MSREDKMPFKEQEGQNIQQAYQKENASVSLEENSQEFQEKSNRGWMKLISFSLLAISIAGLIGGGAGYLWGQSFKSKAEVQRNKHLEHTLAENDSEVTVKELKTAGYLTDKQVEEAKKLLQLDENTTITLPINIPQP